MGVPFTQYPGGLPAPSPGPASIFVAGILDFPGDITPVSNPRIDLCDNGAPKASWPSITKVYRIALSWSYTSRELAESVLSEFASTGSNPFDYTYPGDGHTYRCYWENAPTTHPVTFTAIWMVTGSLLAVRIS